MNAAARPTWITLVALTALLALGATACGPKTGIDTVPSQPATDAGAESGAAAGSRADELRDVEVPSDDFRAVTEKPTRDVLPDPRSAAEYNRMDVLQPIFFAYDSSELTAQARSTMQANATWLEAHPELHVVVEGHCDERGTIEYNLSLGQRRARSVRDYLVTLGVARDRVRTVSYGEERPVDRGHAESAWSKNRRAAFTLEDR